MKRKTNIKRLVLGFLIAGGIFWGCQARVEDLTGPSSLGNILGIQGLFGEDQVAIQGDFKHTAPAGNKLYTNTIEFTF